jgi:hypothetical protein
MYNRLGMIHVGDMLGDYIIQQKYTKISKNTMEFSIYISDCPWFKQGKALRVSL